MSLTDQRNNNYVCIIIMYCTSTQLLWAISTVYECWSSLEHGDQIAPDARWNHGASLSQLLLSVGTSFEERLDQELVIDLMTP